MADSVSTPVPSPPRGPDLTGWSDLAVDPYLTVVDGPDGTETVAVTVPLESLGGTESRFFVRLKSIRP